MGGLAVDLPTVRVVADVLLLLGRTIRVSGLGVDSVDTVEAGAGNPQKASGLSGGGVKVDARPSQASINVAHMLNLLGLS